MCDIPLGLGFNKRPPDENEGDIRVVPNAKVLSSHSSRCPLIVIRKPFRDENLDHGQEPGRGQPQHM